MVRNDLQFSKAGQLRNGIAVRDSRINYFSLAGYILEKQRNLSVAKVVVT